MNLNSLDIELRPRNNWEAFDLGKSLLSRYFKNVYIPWIITNIFLILLTLPICFYSFSLAVLVYIYLIPVAERTVLLVISRAVFGEKLNLRETLKVWKTQIGNGLFSYYLFYRFLPTRALILPVWQLENLKGKALSTRLKSVSYNSSNTAGWIGVFFSLLELLVTFVILEIGFLFVPDGVVDWEAFWLDLFLIGPPLFLTVIYTTVYILVVLTLRPVLVAGGFALYLHRRMVLEGWDIELQFRSLASRISQFLIPLLIVSLFVFSPASQASEKPQEAVERIMKMEEFNNTKTIEGRRYIDAPPSGEMNLSGFAFVIKFIFIAFIIFLIGALIYFIVKNVKANKIEVKSFKAVKPIRNIMGMDITEETLPDDIAGEAEKLIKDGQLRAGLALLYRGSLFKLVNSYGIALKSSYTENDCLNKVGKPVPGQTKDYFTKLTNLWLMLAYAHIEPEHDSALNFCKDWNEAFKAVSRIEAK